jgi:Flp pilus assembly protein TadD
MSSRRPWQVYTMAAFWLGACGLSGCQVMSQTGAAGGVLPGKGDAATTLEPRQVADIRIAQGQVLARRGDLEQAQEALLQAVQRDPSRADAWARLAVLADQQGNFAKSEGYYRKAQALVGDNSNLSCDRGYSYYLQRRWQEAEASLRQAIALDASNRRSHNNLGLVYAHSGRPDEALAEFRSAGCSPTEAQANLAFSLALEGSWPEAQAAYERALAADPASVPARQGLGMINALLARAPLAQQPSPGLQAASSPQPFGPPEDAPSSVH